MRDVAIHDPSSNPLVLEVWLGKQQKFGVAATEKHLVIPIEEAGSVRRFDSFP